MAARGRRPRAAQAAGDPELPPSYQALLDRVRRAFGFLERELGFAPPKVIFRFPDLVIRYDRGDRGVQLHSEYFGEPWVQIRPPDPAQRFGLNEAIEALQPATWAEHPPRKRGALDPDEAGAWVHYYAGFLRAQARACLEDVGATFEAVARLRAAQEQGAG